MEEITMINPFMLALWVKRVQTILADGNDLRKTLVDIGWTVCAAVSSLVWSWVGRVGGVIEVPASVQGRPKLERFSFTVGLRMEQNLFSGELKAIAYALRYLPDLEYRSLALWVGNRAAVLTI
jgi:hypothetical protein